jgi:hypothetical protein
MSFELFETDDDFGAFGEEVDEDVASVFVDEQGKVSVSGVASRQWSAYVTVYAFEYT